MSSIGIGIVWALMYKRDFFVSSVLLHQHDSTLIRGGWVSILSAWM